LNCDFYAWFVDPRVKGTGFAPHRDHLENSPEDSFTEDGLPRNCTLWVSLTDATPSNSCLHVLPARFDPCYSNPETYNTNPAEFIGELDRVHHIRALPAPAGFLFFSFFSFLFFFFSVSLFFFCFPFFFLGSCVLFGDRLIHWGSAVSINSSSSSSKKSSKSLLSTPQPRVSIAVSFAEEENEPSFFSREFLPLPPLELRIALVCAQRLRMYKNEPLDNETATLLWDFVYSQLKLFDQSYARKVARCDPAFRVLKQGGISKYENIKIIMPSFF